MNRLITASFFASALVAAPFVFADEPSAPAEPTEAPAAAEPTIVTPDQVVAMLADGSCTPVDANGASTRESLGTLPGALLLGDEGPTTALLGDDMGRALVFYCGSERCSAAPQAARTAMGMGYTNVSVMSAGIRGWVAAGHAAAPIATDGTAND